MCSDVIEERYVGGEGGVVTRIRIEPDYDATPFEADCYTVEDIAAWRNDEWRYVVVIVSDEDTGWSTALGGVEYGQLGEVSIGMDRIIEDHLDDMRAEATTQYDE